MLAAVDMLAHYSSDRWDLEHGLDALKWVPNKVDALPSSPSTGICSRSRRRLDHCYSEWEGRCYIVEEYLVSLLKELVDQTVVVLGIVGRWRD